MMNRIAKKPKKVKKKSSVPQFNGFSVEERIEFESTPDNYFPFNEETRERVFPRRSFTERENFTKKTFSYTHINSILAGTAVLGYCIFVSVSIKRFFFWAKSTNFFLKKDFAKNRKNNSLTLLSGVAIAGIYCLISFPLFFLEPN